MNKKILFILILIFLLSCEPKENQVCFDKNCLNVEIASTEEARNAGLMNRPSLEKDRGMLFIFQEEGRYTFWMKNMTFPLDMIWINKNMEVIAIGTYVEPCTKGPICYSITPDKEALYVLEVNTGTADELGINLGDKVDIKIQ